MSITHISCSLSVVILFYPCFIHLVLVFKLNVTRHVVVQVMPLLGTLTVTYWDQVMYLKLFPSLDLE